MRTRPYTARIAAVLILLSGGTIGLASVFLMLNLVLAFHDLSDVPLPIVAIILVISEAGELYNLLAVAAPPMLPLGIPTVALFAVLIAGTSR